MMISLVNNFKKSFRKFSNKRFWYVFLVDIIYWGLFWLLWKILNIFVAYQDNKFSGGMTIDQVKEALITASPEELSVFLSQLKIFLVSVFGSILIFVIMVILLFTLSRMIIWNIILKKEFKRRNYWKWIWIVLVSFFVFLISLVPFLIIKLTAMSLISRFGHNTLEISGQVINLIYFLAFVLFFFLYCYNFIEERKVWHSLGKTFELIKNKFRKIATVYLFSLLLAVGLSLVLYLILGVVSALQFRIVEVSGLLTVLFLVWMRFYLVESVN